MHIFQVTDCGTVTALVSETQPVKSGTLSLQLSESTPVLTPSDAFLIVPQTRLLLATVHY